MQTIVEVNNLSVSYDGEKVFENISFSMVSKQIIGIIGPNGAGKSTLMKAIMGLLEVDQGKIKVMDQPVIKMRKKIAYVPQRNNIDLDFPVTVEDVVMMGRYPHMTWWKMPSGKDRKIVEEALQQVEMLEYRHRQIGQLSGGQQQRVFLARALAQEAEILFLDEPFAAIDVISENMIMNLLKKLRDNGKTIFVVHHDLSKAESYFDSLILMKNKIIAYGKREEVFCIDNLCKAYDDMAAVFCSQKNLKAVNG
ncbi:iron/zinc/copper transport system ATP-binding protein [Natranaerovirga pectinivora]|uniref:Iron/zinc/copper transport system ATP-binding protein n=1 Tax=Natranaerovirga pectinivora TaxID=682400 RepID=A0A4R3MLF0_9FIRM|nr:metal ABC transporter ATP-binding protein [Natranaerovirga pectinivora]TCT14934.1 iron/zinc/copper transport system ATP-binding protein [Natranaerovirga pectinivora]